MRDPTMINLSNFDTQVEKLFSPLEPRSFRLKKSKSYHNIMTHPPQSISLGVTEKITKVNIGVTSKYWLIGVRSNLYLELYMVKYKSDNSILHKSGNV